MAPLADRFGTEAFSEPDLHSEARPAETPRQDPLQTLEELTDAVLRGTVAVQLAARLVDELDAAGASKARLEATIVGLKNSLSYAHRGERGAAAYELRLVRRHLPYPV